MDSFSVICISLHDTDKIRVMNLPRDMVDSLRAIIQSSWQRGIQSEGSYAISHEFKLHGKPWLGEGEEANDSRRLIARILGFMLQRGWALTIATDISKKRYGLDTMYFKRQIPEPNVLTSAISFNKTDLIRVIDGTVELAEVVRSAIQNCWHRGLQDARTYYGGARVQDAWQSVADLGD